MREETREKLVKIMNCLSIFICAVSLLIAIYLISQDAGLIEGWNFGPGSYYYSDIPIWKEIFLSDKTLHLGFENPIAAYGFFIIWGLLSFKVLLWLDKKLK